MPFPALTATMRAHWVPLPAPGPPRTNTTTGFMRSGWRRREGAEEMLRGPRRRGGGGLSRSAVVQGRQRQNMRRGSTTARRRRHFTPPAEVAAEASAGRESASGFPPARPHARSDSGRNSAMAGEEMQAWRGVGGAKPCGSHAVGGGGCQCCSAEQRFRVGWAELLFRAGSVRYLLGIAPLLPVSRVGIYF